MRDLSIVRKDLEEMPTSHFVTKWMMDATPYIFEENPMEYLVWRETLAIPLKIDPTDIIISGSACLGFSLNPNKNFKQYDETSDIDVCIISPYYFDTAWRDLLTLDIGKLPRKMQNAVVEHRQRLIYWGTIATDKILPVISFGPIWDKLIRENRRISALTDRDINFRVYKDRRSIRDYLINGIERSKEPLWRGE